MPLFYLRGGRARRQVGCGWFVIWRIGILLSAFRRVFLTQQNKLLCILPVIYNAAFSQKAWFQHDKSKFVPMTKPAHKEKDARQKEHLSSSISIPTLIMADYSIFLKNLEKVGVVFFCIYIY